MTEIHSSTETHDFSERVLRDMSSAVLVVDRKGNIVYVNQAASSILELEPGQITVPFRDIVENEYNDAFSDAVFSALYNREETNVRRVPFMAASGRKYMLHMTCSYLDTDDDDAYQLVITITDETEVEKMRQKFRDASMTFSTFLFGFCGWMIVYALWEFLGRPIAADFMTHGVEVLGIVMLLFVLRHTSFSWKDLGIGTSDPWKTVRTAAVVAFCSFVFLCILKVGISLIAPGFFAPGVPFFDISLFGIRQILYVFTAGIQEFLARSVMQGNLKRIMATKHNGAMAILLSSMIFAALHIHFGLLFMLGAAILAGLEGILYDRQNSIYGVWIVHWVFGVCGTLLSLIDH